MSNQEEAKKDFAYSVTVKQSLTSGIVAFDVTYSTDYAIDALKGEKLLTIFKNVQEAFSKDGFKVASIIPNNMKDLANKQQEKKTQKEIENENKEKAQIKG
jgi:hypothetical protein